MNEPQNSEPPSLTENLAEIQAMLLSCAREHREDDLALLAILRSLEAIHRQICEEFFLPALPDNRRELSRTLRDIEEMGGWPYIERMRLRALLRHFEENSREKDGM